MILFIVNPVSANGRGRKVWLDLKDQLEAKEISYSVRFTDGPNHATVLASNGLKENVFSAVVAVGGDGTVHEVAQALIGTDIPLGFVPAGSGNDFARALDISTNSIKALERILSCKPRSIDMAQIDHKYFVNGAGIGFDGAVAKVTNESAVKHWLNRIKLGRYAYFLNAVRLLFTFRPTDVSLVIDGEHHLIKGVWLVAVSNIPFYGGGMKICPEAVLDDGLLDICIVHNMNRFQFLLSLGKVFKGTHVDVNGVLLLKGRDISIHPIQSYPIHTDGEYHQLSPTCIKIKEKTLKVL